ncbi:MAG TPA: tRNA pseudouridine(38-40) synthase TruA [Verrucomicrobiae bacterium]|jgi:tRNA pseudouridine38-40 synthase|nr:tRNA pseudouridine(38-40) synthase TruA [Verrucomicrobiae bacterium]
MNIKLTIEYDGTDYCGWQAQPNGTSVQQTIEAALEKILGAKIRLNGSGRTDAGVHALGQVANFVCDGEVDLWRLQRGLNAVTPRDISIRRVEAAADHFDARRDARLRHYRYRIWNDRWPSAIERRYSWHVHEPLDLAAMERAIVGLEGDHDFAAFQAAGCEAAHSVRRVYRNSIRRERELVHYDIEANAFLRHMVRNIVGTLVEVGRGERRADSFAELIDAKDRTLAGPTAPPSGLFLLEVGYEENR